MRRADRLFQMVQILRRKRLVTALQLASELHISERTVYRDIQDLVLSGIPISGEAGMGYSLPRNFDLPPMMFTAEELDALVLGTRIVGAWGDPDLAKAAQAVLDKVRVVIPERMRGQLDEPILFAPDFHIPYEATAQLGEIRAAIKARKRIGLLYLSGEVELTYREVRPLGLFYWGRWWSLAAWCELRQGFRSFRIDRIADANVLDSTWEENPQQNLAAFLRHQEEA